MKKEYIFVFIGALYLLSYVLDAVVNPLPNIFTSPYGFLKPDMLKLYPFTAAIIAIRTVALVLSPLWLISFFEKGHTIKGLALLVLSGLLQLYSIQEVVAKTKVVPLEWSISFAYAGVILLLPAVLQFLLGIFHKAKEKLAHKTSSSENPETINTEVS